MLQMACNELQSARSSLQAKCIDADGLLARSISVAALAAQQLLDTQQWSCSPLAAPEWLLISRGWPAVQVSAFKVTLKTPDGDQEIECADDTYILDAAEEAGIDLPYSCRAGQPPPCVAAAAIHSTEQLQ